MEVVFESHIDLTLEELVVCVLVADVEQDIVALE